MNSKAVVIVGVMFIIFASIAGYWFVYDYHSHKPFQQQKKNGHGLLKENFSNIMFDGNTYLQISDPITGLFINSGMDFDGNIYPQPILNTQWQIIPNGGYTSFVIKDVRSGAFLASTNANEDAFSSGMPLQFTTNSTYLWWTITSQESGGYTIQDNSTNKYLNTLSTTNPSSPVYYGPTGNFHQSQTTQFCPIFLSSTPQVFYIFNYSD